MRKVYSLLSKTSDLYEFSLSGRVISRITLFFQGTQNRQEVDFDQCPEEVQDEILKRVMEECSNEK